MEVRRSILAFARNWLQQIVSRANGFVRSSGAPQYNLSVVNQREGNVVHIAQPYAPGIKMSYFFHHILRPTMR